MHCRIAVETVDQPEAIALIDELDAHLAPLYPPESQHGLSVSALRASHVLFVLARDESGTAHGCGAITFQPGYAELKRMYVRPSARGRGIADEIVAVLEREAGARGYATVMLETGISQLAALSFYERLGYMRREPFGHYRPDPLSIFMEKRLGAGG